MVSGRKSGRRLLATISTLAVLGSALVLGLQGSTAGAVAPPVQAPTGPIASASLSSTSPTVVIDDPVHRHVFVADGVNTIQVFDYDAKPVTTITNVGAVNGMVLYDGTIYATNATAGLVERISTVTLSRGTDLATDLAGPRTPVVLGGRLWLGTGGCDGTFGGQVTRIDLATGTVISTWPEPVQRYCPILAGVSSPGILRYDISSGTPTNVLESTAGADNLGQIAMDPDGQHWYSASGYPYGIKRWKTSDMSDLGVAFPINPYPTAVAVMGANGGFVAGGVNGIYDPDVAVFDSHDVLTKRFSWDFGTTDDVMKANGLAFSGDGSRLFTVAKGGLRIFALPGVAGTVANAAGAPQPGVKVEAVATSDGAVIDSATTDENGWFAIDRAGFTADQTYQVRYTDPLTGWVGWRGPGGLPVDQSIADTYAFSADHGQPAGVTMALAGAAYHPVTPTRLVDTRTGQGTPATPMGPFDVLGITVPGAGGVLPGSGISAVVLNVTAVAPQSDGYLTLWPAGATTPPTSNVNYVTGTTVPNLVTVAVGVDGAVLLGNAFGRTDVIVDVAGWFDAGIHTGGSTGYHPQTPVRALDTRDGTGGVTQPLGPGASIDVLMKGGDTGVPSGAVAAVALNVTVTGTTSDGYLTVSPTGEARPNASNLNWRKGVTVPNMVIAKLSADGHLDFFNSAGSTSLIVDVVGWFDNGTTGAGDGGMFHPVTPGRVLDTRDGTGAAQAPVGQQQSINVRFAGAGGVPSSGASAVVANTTATKTSSWGFLTVWPDGVNRPTASNLNWAKGQTIANLVLTQLSPSGWARFYNANGATDVIGDVAGWFDTP